MSGGQREDYHSELFSAVLHTTIIVHSYKLQLLWTASDLGLVKGFLPVLGCFIYLGPVCSFSVFFCVFSPVCFELSVSVQAIASKDSSLK